jgi:hypothetical protein
MRECDAEGSSASGKLKTFQANPDAVVHLDGVFPLGVKT